MHSLRLLTLLLPELKLIDSLVVRDFYHRFTVDEHSFLAIESLHRLKASQSGGTSVMRNCSANWKIPRCSI